MILFKCFLFSTIIPAMKGTGELTKSSISLGNKGMNADAHLYGSRSSSSAVVHAVTSSDVSPTTRTDLSKSSSFKRMINPESLILRKRVDTPHCPETSGSGSGTDILLNPMLAKSTTKRRRWGFMTCAISSRGWATLRWSGVSESLLWSAAKILCRSWLSSEMPFWLFGLTLFERCLSRYCNSDGVRVQLLRSKWNDWQN